MSFKRVPFKRVLFRLHWICGLTAGLVLAVTGFTGGLLGFEEPLLRLLNPQLHIEAAARSALTPDRWVAAARAAQPQLQPRSVAWSGDDTAVAVRMARGKERGSDVLIDPYTGQVLGESRGEAFFQTVEQLHRTLAAGPVGKQIVGASTALLIVLILSGLYLRWPRRARSAAAWFRVDFRLKGRPFWWQLHAVAGTCLLFFYLLSALTGLWWSYDFYRNAVNGLAGVTTPLRRPQPPGGDTDAPLLPLDGAWTSFRLAVPAASQATIALTSKPATPIEIRYLTTASPHPRAFDTRKFDAASGAEIEHELYAELPRGRRFVSSIYPLHSGSLAGWPGRIVMAVAALLLPTFALTGLWLWLLRRRNEARRRPAAAAAPNAALAELRRSDARAG
ncbi:MAG TPA: PepSY-associated TM helix domain-containing protein [Dokdonella sp.]